MIAVGLSSRTPAWAARSARAVDRVQKATIFDSRYDVNSGRVPEATNF